MIPGIAAGYPNGSPADAVNAPSVTMICRQVAVRDANPFVAPLSSRYDDLDGQMWLDDVFIPWARVFLLGESPEPVACWLIWHHLYDYSTNETEFLHFDSKINELLRRN